MSEPASDAPLSYRVELRNPRALKPAGERKIVFHGINKSGSSAMAKVLEAAYAQAGRSAEFHSHYRGVAASDEDFRRLIERTPGPGFFVNHYLYGTFHVPRASRLLVTLFRHPLPRTVSCYQWLKRKAIATNGESASFPSLEDWVRKSRGRAHSQVTQFAMPFVADRGKILAPRSDAELLEMARDNIERDVDCIGIAEYFEDSIFLFAHLCGVERVPPWKRDRRNKGRQLVWDLPAETQALIREVMQMDFELYEWAVERFFSQLRRAAIGGDIAAYRLACEQEYKDRLADRDPRRAATWLERAKQGLGMYPRFPLAGSGR